MADGREFLREVSWEEVAEELGKHVDSLHSVLATIQNACDRNDRSVTLFKLGFACARQVERAQGWVEQGNDLLA